MAVGAAISRPRGETYNTQKSWANSCNHANSPNFSYDLFHCIAGRLIAAPTVSCGLLRQTLSFPYQPAREALTSTMSSNSRKNASSSSAEIDFGIISVIS